MSAAAGAEVAPPVDAALIAAIDRCLADPAYREAFRPYDIEDPGDEGAEEEPKRFAEVCADVHDGVVAGELGPYLPADWSGWMPEEKLGRLRTLLAGEQPAAGPRLDTSAVPAIVETTQAAVAPPEKSLWQRFKAWLRSLIAERGDEGGEGWFSGWLRDHMPGESTLDTILYVLLAAIFGAVAWFVYAELRAAGLIRRWRRAPRAQAAPAPAVAAIGPALAGASESEAPSILVTLLVGELRRLGRVQDRLSMTHRELLRAARFDSAEDGEVFGHVLGTAEQICYGDSPPAAGALRQVVDAGRRLLASLARRASSPA